MKILIDDPSKTLTFDVNGDPEDLIIVKQSLERLPHILVVEEIPKFTGKDISTISITCQLASYNNVIKILQDFIEDDY